ncbi:hypothetical protein Q0F99_19660 [Rathayibacter oskolensis]|nr:hypothetical protein [Rathayibacter oskolensis]WKK71529.1 hypothetical protein Q0F99_19660 [Rathayibacter oskolensis]
MSAAALLASGVLGAAPRDARERIAGISTVYSELSEIEDRA